MGRPKGGTNRYWSKEAKLAIIQQIMAGEKGSRQVARDETISAGMVSQWLKRYREGGEAALENKKKPGNPLARYSNRKELTPMEQLEYENMKLKIENLRLKKGYTNEEADRAKKRPSGKSTKSSKS